MLMNRFRPAYFAIAAIVAALGLSACKEQGGPTDVRTKDRVVLVASVEPADDFDPAYTGIVAARVQSDLGFRVQARSSPDSSTPVRP